MKRARPHLAIIRPLHRWYQKTKRILPWRSDPAPYKVWVSEIMLQQTQVAAVIPYFEKFLKRFPDFASLAGARESEVLAHWSGLGYYSRARNMHLCARRILQDFDGKFPDDIEQVKNLPGIGPYTAGAILSIAFNQPRPILDGNVRRILSRIFLETETSELWRLSGGIVARASSRDLPPSEVNQALMELGALVCLPKNPSCAACPVRGRCLANLRGLEHSYPPAKKKPQPILQRYSMYLISKNSPRTMFLFRKRGSDEKWFKNMWELPMVPVSGGGFLPPGVRAQLEIRGRLGFISHAITRHRLKIEVLKAQLPDISEIGSSRWRWVEPKDISKISTSSIVRKALALLN